MEDWLEIAGNKYRSRLIVGTGKYKDFAETKRAIEVSGAEIVTVAVRRVNITDPEQRKFARLSRSEKIHDPAEHGRLLQCRRSGANSAGWRAKPACGKLVKLEVIGDDKTLFPDVPATLEAAKILVKEGFDVLPYITDDPITAKKLQDIGCAAVMPLAAPIGSDWAFVTPTIFVSSWNRPRCR